MDAGTHQGPLAALLLALVALGAPAPARAATRQYWVAAVPVRWNAVPNGLDAIHGMHYDRSETVFPTTTYQRYSRAWRRALPGRRIPGPLLSARVGDRLLVHFKNLDTRTGNGHSMHFHGVAYRPTSDGAYVPGFSGRDGDVPVRGTYTYRLRAGRDSAGVWPYHDHGPAMEESLAGGMYGALSIRDRGERVPDREFVVVFAPFGGFQAIDGRAFVGNTPVFQARVGEVVQWDVLAFGDEHHTFHVHGHRWRDADGVPLDTRTLGPAASFRVRWIEDVPGTWLYHCHVEAHMANGMIGLYHVRR